MEILPEELQLHIFDFLDSQPPSEVKARQEPSLSLIKSARRDLKNVSCVSKRWRRIVLPLMFKHACLRLDIPPRPDWEDCEACSGFHRHRRCLLYHTEMLDIMNLSTAGDSTVRRSFSPSDNVAYRTFESATAVWANRMYHVLDDFLIFLEGASLLSAVESFALVTDKMLSEKAGRFPHQSGQHEWRYGASAAFWRHLLSYINPTRIISLAPPTELACLMNASIDTFGDWAFSDMDFHILEFKWDGERPPLFSKDFGYNDLNTVPGTHPGFAQTCLINLRPWTQISLNEGSFLKAYGTYEFFERGPPSLVYSIGQTLTSRHHWRKWNDPGAAVYDSEGLLRSFTYTGIFPFANHADFRHILPHLEELDVQFAPDPQSGILDDKARTGKAELQDCWQELFSAYLHIANTIATFQLLPYFAFPKLKKFVCRDVRIAALKEDLDEIFTPLCLPVWAEYEDGCFTRQALLPPPTEPQP
jgi:hypothetical protein